MPDVNKGRRVVAVVGAREHPDLDEVREYVRSLPRDVVVISGGARGVDQAAVQAAREMGMRTAAWLPQDLARQHAGALEEFSHRDALFYRNTMIAIHCTEMTVFVEGSRGGAWDVANQGYRFRRPVEIRQGREVYEYLGHGKKRVKTAQGSLWEGR